ncbi:CDGSH iron-sulfur domain-containing protein [Streptomyces sp. NPDC003038]|uniref:CDGSH iron-sulfur domain-containing protein n=1 Tax=unclassified Streptomyces TaxID=2593676 RepID=UPI0033B7064E
MTSRGSAEVPPEHDKLSTAAGRAVREPEPGGPELVEGPVERARRDGSIAYSDRPVVALCTCRRSRIFPWCDTSHRTRVRGRSGDCPPGTPPADE